MSLFPDDKASGPGEPLTQPIKWHGGKHYLAPKIVALFSPRAANPNAPATHDPGYVHYVEPYAGGLSVLLAKTAEMQKLKVEASRVLGRLQKLLDSDDVNVHADVRHNEPFAVEPVTASPAKSTTPPAEGLAEPQQAILDTISMLNTRGISPSRECVARWLAIHPNGGRYGTNLAWLRSNGYLDGLALTNAGQAAARALPTGLDAALAALPDDSMRRTLQAVVDAGQPLSRDELAERLGIHPNGGRFGTTLGWLRTMCIITPRGPIQATEGLWR